MKLAFVCAAALILLLFVDAEGKKTKKKATGVLSASKLAPYVKCGACMAMGKSLYAQANEIKKEKGGRKKMGEEPVLELLESICEAGTKEGEWINQLDVVGDKGKLSLEVRENGFQDCATQECIAIARSCDDVRTEAGESDIAEKIYQGHYTSSEDDFAKALCNKMTEMCHEVPELSSKRIDEPFVLIESTEWETKKMTKMMKSMGMGGEVYDRNSMQDYLDEYPDEYLPEEGYSLGDHSSPPPPTGPSPDDDGSFSNFVKDTLSIVSASAEYAVNTVVEGIRQAVEAVSGKPRTPEL